MIHSVLLCRVLTLVVVGVWIGCVLGVPFSAPAADLEILVPAYFDPGATGGLWNDLNMAATQVPLTAILNPASGPGAAFDSDYNTAVNALRTAGGRVVGYVPTSYGTRPFDQVQVDIDAYDSWYNLDGIFIDEMSNSGAQGLLDYYGDIYSYIHALNVNWEMIGNPGTNTVESYLMHPAADRLVVFESDGAAYAGYTRSAWNAGYDAAHFSHLVHSTPSTLCA